MHLVARGVEPDWRKGLFGPGQFPPSLYEPGPASLGLRLSTSPQCKSCCSAPIPGLGCAPSPRVAAGSSQVREWRPNTAFRRPPLNPQGVAVVIATSAAAAAPPRPRLACSAPKCPTPQNAMQLEVKNPGNPAHLNCRLTGGRGGGPSESPSSLPGPSPTAIKG